MAQSTKENMNCLQYSDSYLEVEDFLGWYRTEIEENKSKFEKHERNN